MGFDVFGSLTSSPVSVGTRKWYTVPLSVLAHMVALLALVVVPLVATGMLPTPESVMVFTVTPPAPPAPQPPAPPTAEKIVPVEVPANREAAPVQAPDRIAAEP